MRKYHSLMEALDCGTPEEVQQLLDDEIELLTLQEDSILRLRFGIDVEHGLELFHEPWTFKRIADHFDLTPERVRQVEVKGLRKIRMYFGRKAVA